MALTIVAALGALLIGGGTLVGCADASPGLPASTPSSLVDVPVSLAPPPPIATTTTTVEVPATTTIAVVPAAPPAPVAGNTGSGGSAQQDCGADSYVNVDGNCVHRPVQAPTAPAGATAKCNDGSYSFSKHHSGTCSGHGGVAEWL